jgi:hypothetical protein
MVELPCTSDRPVAKACTWPHTTPKKIKTSMHLVFFSCFLSFFLSVLFIHCVPFYPLSSCHLFLYNTQHKYPCRRQDSNPQSQQASGHRPRRRPRGHWDRQESNPQYQKASGHRPAPQTAEPPRPTAWVSSWLHASQSINILVSLLVSLSHFRPQIQ